MQTKNLFPFMALLGATALATGCEQGAKASSETSEPARTAKTTTAPAADHDCTAACDHGDKHAAPKAGGTVEVPAGTPLFEATLQYRSDDPKDALDLPGDRAGALIGSGDGTVTGRLAGAMRWSFYSEQCAYLLVKAGKDVPEGQHLCYLNPGGYLDLDDGAKVRWDGRGYGFRAFDPERPHLWRIGMTMQFATEDPRYAWLNESFGFWDGRFDESAGRSVVRVSLQGRGE